MDSSYREFLVGLHEEHVEEASFLYEQRVGLLAGGALAWAALGPFEERLEAHIDALVLGGDRALTVCRAAVRSDDAGALFTVLCVFCRQRRPDLVAEALHAFDLCNAAFVQAAADALSLELPDDWTGFVDSALRRDARLLPVLARVAGSRRLPVTEALLDTLEFASAEGAEAAVRALGFIAHPASRASLERCMNRPERAVRSAVLVSLLRIGAQHVLEPWFVTAQKETWPRAAFALGGDATVPPLFGQALRADHDGAECLHAIGQLGDPAMLEWLYHGLRHPELAVPAARALNRLTGADLYEEHFKPEPVDEAELFDDELRAWRESGQPPMRADGRPYGETVMDLSTHKDSWKAWLAGHYSRYADGTRYRRGLPCEPCVLLAELTDERSCPAERASAADELAIRYACPVPFDIAMTVAAQRRALQDIEVWVARQGTHFKPGGWYFAGKPL